MVGAGGGDVNELEIRACFWTGREGRECEKDGCIFVDFCSGDGGE